MPDLWPAHPRKHDLDDDVRQVCEAEDAPEELRPPLDALEPPGGDGSAAASGSNPGTASHPEHRGEQHRVDVQHCQPDFVSPARPQRQPRQRGVEWQQPRLRRVHATRREDADLPEVPDSEDGPTVSAILPAGPQALRGRGHQAQLQPECHRQNLP